LTNAENVKNYINENTKLIWAETPTNPTMQIIDIEAVATIAKANNIIMVADNTLLHLIFKIHLIWELIS
jgi:cystathionine beta-lyase/cystathionine gamma-synthase